MHRPGCDPDHLEMSDVLCDFCGLEWADDRPMVEGHRGACICGSCLTRAYEWSATPQAVETAPVSPQPTDAPAPMCALCREDRAEPMWTGAGSPPALACRRCVRQSAAVLQKDADSGWKRPGAEAAPLR